MADLVACRDGPFMTMLAARGHRLRAMTALRVGTELLREGDHYRIELSADLVKIRKPDHFSLPEALSPYGTHYIAAVRPLLLSGRRSDTLWINRHGAAMNAALIANQMVRRTRRAFGTAYGPHRFRHNIATTAALTLPDQPGLADGLLGISGAVFDQHYNMAGQVEAATSYAELVERREQGVRIRRAGRWGESW